MLHHVTLQRGFTIEQCRHNIAVMGFFTVLQNYDVSIDNMSANHRVAPDAQGECAEISENVSRPLSERHVTFDDMLCECRHAWQDLRVSRNIPDPDLHHWSNQRLDLGRVPSK